MGTTHQNISPLLQTLVNVYACVYGCLDVVAAWLVKVQHIHWVRATCDRQDAGRLSLLGLVATAVCGVVDAAESALSFPWPCCKV